tara:strand:- start:7910 stop:8584 length:675 start_codon:yes stop_codon:yes gene_type:complete
VLDILFEDNHLLILNKKSGELSQGDITEDKTLVDKAKFYLKAKYNKKGNVFIGLIHRLDRPTSGVIVLSKTSKSLKRMNDKFKMNEVDKVYWAVTNSFNKNEGKVESFLKKNQKQNKSYVVESNISGSKNAILYYKKLVDLKSYTLLEIKLETGRHHQIRTQLASLGYPIKGDLKYGFPRSNVDKSIHLHARHIEFTHPVTKNKIKIEAPPPNDKIWNLCLKSI